MSALIDGQNTGPTGFLYHYTSQRGFLGILDNKKIWATNIHYLNDSAELYHAIDVLQSGLDNICEHEHPSEHERKFFDELSKRLSENRDPYNPFSFQSPVEDKSFYVCSFSSKADQLSQWRGYCPDGNGYCIGFDFSSVLLDKVKQQGFELMECIYANEDGFPILMQQFLSEARKTFNKTPNKLTITVSSPFLLNGNQERE